MDQIPDIGEVTRYREDALTPFACRMPTGLLRAVLVAFCLGETAVLLFDRPIFMSYRDAVREVWRVELPRLWREAALPIRGDYRKTPRAPVVRDVALLYGLIVFYAVVAAFAVIYAETAR